MEQNKILFVANVAKEHLNKFHGASVQYFQSQGWRTDIACKVDAEVPFGDHIYNMRWGRSPLSWGTIKGIFDLRKLIRENKYDVVYSHTLVGGIVGRLACIGLREKGVASIYCSHGLHFFKGAPLMNWIIFYPIEKVLTMFTDMIISINHEDVMRLKRHFNKKMIVEEIPGIGVNFDRLRSDDIRMERLTYRKLLGLPNNAVAIIYVAEITNNKNQQMLVRALNELRSKGVNAYLLLVGPDHQRHHNIQKLIAHLDLKAYVQCLGWRSDIGPLLRASDICVASSVREGFGINLVEAMYCHLPVVAVDNRGHRTIINDGENGFLVPMNDYKMMAERIEQVWADKALYDRLANQDVTKYESEKVAKQIFGYISDFVSGKYSSKTRK